MTINLQISSEPQDCAQCMRLGLPKETIAAGEVHVVMAHENIVRHCCHDCFARLQEERNEGSVD